MATLPVADAAALLDAGVPREFNPGDVLVHEGEHTDHVLLVLFGYAKVTAGDVDGGVALLAIRGSGDLIGELAALDGEPRSATVVAVNRVRAAVISRGRFHDFLLRHPVAAEAVTRSVAAKLRWANRRRVDFSGCTVKVRIARVLLDLAANFGRPTSDGVHIAVPLTQPELAALVGAAEPTVHKVLADLRKRALVRTGYRAVTVLEHTALRALAGP
ncbi:Crp/Fnr family transcriptional regulator [Actinosynnema sp. NPDC020468]|uniref:Crp/Fnr family transcriptional regulator n=1 Tax=Actinosynnema sp. NPDC020468 TaxID=3154488 RepID=UPI0033C4F296